MTADSRDLKMSACFSESRKQSEVSKGKGHEKKYEKFWPHLKVLSRLEQLWSSLYL